MIFVVTNKATGAEVSRYAATQIIAGAFPLADFNHDEHPADEPDAAPVVTWRIHVGALFDRFGTHKLAILASQDPLVQAIIKDASVRQYIALTERRDELLQAIGLLNSKGFVIDPVAVLDVEPTTDEVWNG